MSYIMRKITVKDAILEAIKKYRIGQQTQDYMICQNAYDFVALYYPQRHNRIVLLVPDYQKRKA